MYAIYEKLNSSVYIHCDEKLYKRHSNKNFIVDFKNVSNKNFKEMYDTHQSVSHMRVSNNCQSINRFTIELSEDVLTDELLNLLEENKEIISLLKPNIVFNIKEKISNYNDIKFINDYIVKIKSKNLNINLYHIEDHYIFKTIGCNKCQKDKLCENCGIDNTIPFGEKIYQKINYYLEKYLR